MKEIYKLCITRLSRLFITKWSRYRCIDKGDVLPIRYMAIINNLIDYNNNASVFPFHRNHIYNGYDMINIPSLEHTMDYLIIQNYYNDFKYLLKNIDRFLGDIYKNDNLHYSQWSIHNTFIHILNISSLDNLRFIFHILKNYTININVSSIYHDYKIMNRIIEKYPRYIDQLLENKEFMDDIIGFMEDSKHCGDYIPITFYRYHNNTVSKIINPDFLNVANTLYKKWKYKKQRRHVRIQKRRLRK